MSNGIREHRRRLVEGWHINDTHTQKSIEQWIFKECIFPSSTLLAKSAKVPDTTEPRRNETPPRLYKYTSSSVPGFPITP